MIMFFQLLVAIFHIVSTAFGDMYQLAMLLLFPKNCANTACQLLVITFNTFAKLCFFY